ncbi:eukaryotic translation initiation factor 2-alpha kinase 1-like, partial [Ctenocephalides felis]|uniref:eukaryotic translation initiation factor 2-alpha kinase 1-like n=1 Tax=Ctenocephalides felis TaxID=7515 RepID=UPI000E6E1127
MDTLMHMDRDIEYKSSGNVHPAVKSEIISFQSKFSTPISLLVESLVQQLCKLLEQDDSRATDLYHTICRKLHQMNLIDETYSMGEFEVMRSQYQNALYQLVTVARGSDLPIKSSIWPLSQSAALEWSRYYREFDEINFIAGGGFGKVYKARHKLDGLDYAIKKVCIKSSIVGNVMAHLSEVKTLASLNHTNIVSYKAAWLEPFLGNKDCKLTLKDETNSESDSTIPSQLHTNLTENSSSSIYFEDPESLEESENNHQNLTEKSCKQVCMYNSQFDLKTNKFVDLKWATLYIQMSLCQMTLRQWLDQRNKSDIDKFYMHYNSVKECIQYISLPHPDSNDSNLLHIKIVIDILKQLSKGLSYIHSKGIVHHDIKPSNIFIGYSDGSINIQLGDFGLACPLKKVHTDNGLGTPLYAAPEQLRGECDIKSDVYSLGIVMLELLQPFNTEMERIENLKALSNGIIDEDIKKSYPELTNLLLNLTRKSPVQRCTTEELLLHLENIYTCNENFEKDKTIKILKKEVAELGEKLKIKDNEIE